MPYTARGPLPQPCVFSIINVDDPRNLFTSSPDISSDNIIIGPSAQIHPLIINQATPLLYRRPNSFSFSYFVCQMAHPNSSLFSRWVLQTHYVCPAFDSHLQRH